MKILLDTIFNDMSYHTNYSLFRAQSGASFMGIGIFGLLSLFGASSSAKKPNIVFILADDLGYTDIGCYGAPKIVTPNLDKLAAEGVRFTNFYAPAGVCTPTRSSLMTGCYPKRVGLHVGVLSPDSESGLNPTEVTMAEVLKSKGYVTGCIGKWHLGLLPEVMPNAQGFDYYYGMPGPNHGISDLYRNTTLLKKNKEVSYDQITIDYTREADAFIRKNKDKPFFLYLAHSMPHVPLAVSEKFKGKSLQGLYGDVIMELDWSVGEIVRILNENGVEKNTILVFTSDNGPSGIAAPPLHGGKGSTWEGGFREPLIVRWPNRIAAGSVCNEMSTMMDFLPTFAKLSGAKLREDREPDGHDIMPLLTGKNSISAYSYFYYYGRDGELAAVKKGNWKLHLLAPSEKWAGKQPVKEALLDTRPTTPLPWLYDLSSDIGETKNIAESNPQIVQELYKQAMTFDSTLTKEIRPAYTKNQTP